MRQNGIKNNHELQSYFNKRILKILTANNKKMVGWDEILQPDSPQDIVIQSWRGRESLIHAAQNGYQVLLSNGYYIDLMQPTTDHYLNDPLTEDMALPPDKTKYILGGEATMWSEFVTPEIIDSRIWPRTAAIAERLWSPADVVDIEDMYRRLEYTSFRLEELGLTHEKNYDMMLRRLTGGCNIEPLRTLVDIVEPLKYYQRGQYRDFTQFSPYTRVMDAARADQKRARLFRELVKAFLADGAKSSDQLLQIRKQLLEWSNNHEKLIPLIDHSAVLQEIRPLSQNLHDCSLVGITIVDAIYDQKELGTVEEFRQILNKAKEPVAQVELMILPALEQLFDYYQKMH